MVARLGGDEFAVLMPGTSGDAMHRPFDAMFTALTVAVAGEGWPISFSVGVIAFEGPIEAAAGCKRAGRRAHVRGQDVGPQWRALRDLPRPAAAPRKRARRGERGRIALIGLAPSSQASPHFRARRGTCFTARSASCQQRVPRCAAPRNEATEATDGPDSTESQALRWRSLIWLGSGTERRSTSSPSQIAERRARAATIGSGSWL